MGTCTLGQSVWEKCALLIFTRELCGAVFCLRVAPHSGRGERPQQHMCCRPVYCLLALFSQDAQEFAFTNVCTCAHLRMFLSHVIDASSFALAH